MISLSDASNPAVSGDLALESKATLSYPTDQRHADVKANGLQGV